MITVTLVADGARTVMDQTTLPNNWMADDATSFDAKGLLAYLATLPTGTHSIDQIADRFGYAPATLTAIVNELDWAGYVQVGGAA